MVGGLSLVATGCLAGGARLRVGPVIDSEGHAAIQADLGIGFGYATTDRSGVMVHAHVGGGSRDRLAVGESVEYVRFADDYGWRSGASFDVAPVDDRFRGWIQSAITYPLRSRHHSGGHEKSFQTSSRSRWSVGIEARGGVVSDSIDEGESHSTRNAAAFGLAATLEWSAFSRVH